MSGRGSVPNLIAPVVFLGILAACVLPVVGLGEAAIAVAILVGSILGGLISASIRIAAQWERLVVFRLGKYVSTRGPGMVLLVPFIDAARVVDTRITTLEIPRRAAITKDNVPLSLDGVIFMRVNEPSEAVTRVRDYEFSIQQYAQTALRDIVGSMTLDEVLADRELVGQKIEQMVETEVVGWGLEVAAIRIQDIELPEDLKRVMARQASAEREKRATITKAEGDRDAASNLAEAAATMNASPGALQLRTLQALEGLGASQSNTIVLTMPVEVMQALQAVKALSQPAPPKE